MFLFSPFPLPPPPRQILSHLTLITSSNSEIENLLRKVLKSSAFKGGDGDSNKRTSRDYDAPGNKGQGDGTRAKENRCVCVELKGKLEFSVDAQKRAAYA